MESGKALLRLFGITALTLFTLFIGIFMLRSVTLSHPPPKAEIPGRSKTPFVFATGDLDQGSPYSSSAYASTLALQQNVIPTLELRVTRDREWVIFGTGPLEQWTDGQGEIEMQNWADLQKLKWKSDKSADGLLRLQDFLAQHQLPKMLLLVHNREVAAAASLVKLLGDRDEPQLTLIHTSNHRLNRELRKQRPQWYFGADAVMLTQWQVFAAIGLDPLAPADFEWLPEGWPELLKHKVTSINDELNRRQIGRILWLNDSSLTNEQMQDPNLMGILTNRPKAILQML